jgi:hypothetical protein
MVITKHRIPEGPYRDLREVAYPSNLHRGIANHPKEKKYVILQLDIPDENVYNTSSRKNTDLKS